MDLSADDAELCNSTRSWPMSARGHALHFEHALTTSEVHSTADISPRRTRGPFGPISDMAPLLIHTRVFP